jgi:RNA polymerase sigma factor (TIGR02999 family)
LLIFLPVVKLPLSRRWESKVPGEDPDLTRLMGDFAAGDARAANELFSHVYQTLKLIARQHMASERPSHTLQATALVHECYLRLFGDSSLRFEARAQFYHAVAQAMRRVLIEHARSRGAQKRDGKRKRLNVELADVLSLAAESDPDQIMAVDEAVNQLEKESPELAEMVRLRFYAGLSIEETAKLLGVSARTVNRDWTYARVCLFKVLEGKDG